MVQLISICSLFFLLTTTFAVSSTENYNPGVYGEKNFDVYFGPHAPDIEHDQYFGKLIWQDHRYQKMYIDHLLQGDLNTLKDFFEHNLYPGMICTNEAIGKKFEYLKFINRLIAMSYLFESLRGHQELSRKMNFAKTCNVNWKNIFRQCQGESTDMKLFLNNVGVVVDKIEPILISVDFSMKSFKQQWIDQFNASDFKDITHYRLEQSCEDCGQLTNNGTGNKKLKNRFQNICNEEVNLFVKICSEQDKIYGMSQIPQAYNLLVNSEILNAINEDEQARGCLRRFNQQFENKELHSPILKAIFTVLYSKQQSRPYPQGFLFPAGSMREFYDKGLVAVFEKEKKIKSKPISISKKVKKEKKPLTVAKTKVISPPKIKDRPEFKPKFKKHKSKVIKSSFLIASEFRKRYDIELSKVDMLKFKYDYIFPVKILKVMQKSMTKFMSKKSLEEMKKYDSLGTKDGPVPLTFIKYMIDHKQHQGLYSLIDILGESFYVKNNIDQVAVPAYDLIKLKNDASTDYQWQLYVLKE